MPDERDNEAGFTLIEMIAVAALLAMMLSILYGTMDGMVRSKQAVESQRITGSVTRLVFERLDKELSSRVAEEITAEDKGQEDPNTPTFQGFQRTYFIGEDKKESQRDADSLRFVSATGAQAVYGARANYGYVEIKYSLVSPPDNQQIEAPKDLPRPLALVREEVPAGVSNEDTRNKRKVVIPISDRIMSFNIRYLKGGSWAESWTNSRRGLPDAVEVSVGVLGEDERIHAASSVIPLAVGPVRSAGRFQGFASAG